MLKEQLRKCQQSHVVYSDIAETYRDISQWDYISSNCLSYICCLPTLVNEIDTLVLKNHDKNNHLTEHIHLY